MLFATKPCFMHILVFYFKDAIPITINEVRHNNTLPTYVSMIDRLSQQILLLGLLRT